MAEKMNKFERKNLSEIFTFPQGQETDDFLKVLGIEDSTSLDEPEEDSNVTFTLSNPTLYQVGLGMGYLELPQGKVTDFSD